MISFQKIGKKGRLGNMLFQVASTIGIATSNNLEYGFNPNELEKYFVGPFPTCGVTGNIVKEKHYHYHNFEVNKGDELDGYFQTVKYWKDCEDVVRSKLEFKPVVIETVKRYVVGNPICISVRRGDFVKNPNYYQLSVRYYILALIENFPDWRERQIIFLSDDIEWCRLHFGCLSNAFFSDELNAYEQMCLGTLCSDFIISNSTFSWWVAYLANRGRVIRPLKNFDGPLARNNDESDFWLDHWQICEHENVKIDATDLTFTIPVFHDHPDRKKNIDLSVCMLQMDFNTNVIVGEQGGAKFEYFGKWGRYINFPYRHFHRTKMLNEMALESTTEYIVNWDCDNILPPMQIYLMLDQLRSGIDMVYPFDGRVFRLNRLKWFKYIESSLDIGTVAGYRITGKNGKQPTSTSVGHAVAFNKERFIEGGGENEFMISWGPEDWERFKRFEKLGFSISRVDGVMYHMDHYIGPNSSRANPFIKKNEEEYEKVNNLDSDQLHAYVSTWPWLHQYTESYYSAIIGGSVKSAEVVFNHLIDAKIIKKDASVVDVGCGIGEWCNGNKNYFGIDYRIPEKMLLIDKDRFFEVNLEKQFPELDRKFDLCLCLEVAEHVKNERSEGLIRSLCSLSDIVLFSAAIPGQQGVGHINEQWQSYWADLFKENGFIPHPFDIRKAVRGDADVQVWYKNNMVIYYKGEIEGEYDIDFVHPQLYTNLVLAGK